MLRGLSTEELGPSDRGVGCGVGMHHSSIGLQLPSVD